MVENEEYATGTQSQRDLRPSSCLGSLVLVFSELPLGEGDTACLEGV